MVDQTAFDRLTRSNHARGYETNIFLNNIIRIPHLNNVPHTIFNIQTFSRMYSTTTRPGLHF